MTPHIKVERLTSTTRVPAFDRACRCAWRTGGPTPRGSNVITGRVSRWLPRACFLRRRARSLGRRRLRSRLPRRLDLLAHTPGIRCDPLQRRLEVSLSHLPGRELLALGGDGGPRPDHAERH